MASERNSSTRGSRRPRLLRAVYSHFNIQTTSINSTPASGVITSTTIAGTAQPTLLTPEGASTTAVNDESMALVLYTANTDITQPKLLISESEPNPTINDESMALVLYTGHTDTTQPNLIMSESDHITTFNYESMALVLYQNPTPTAVAFPILIIIPAVTVPLYQLEELSLQVEELQDVVGVAQKESEKKGRAYQLEKIGLQRYHEDQLEKLSLQVDELQAVVTVAHEESEKIEKAHQQEKSELHKHHEDQLKKLSLEVDELQAVVTVAHEESEKKEKAHQQEKSELHKHHEDQLEKLSLEVDELQAVVTVAHEESEKKEKTHQQEKSELHKHHEDQLEKLSLEVDELQAVVAVAQQESEGKEKAHQLEKSELERYYKDQLEKLSLEVDELQAVVDAAQEESEGKEKAHQLEKSELERYHEDQLEKLQGENEKLVIEKEELKAENEKLTGLQKQANIKIKELEKLLLQEKERAEKPTGPQKKHATVIKELNRKHEEELRRWHNLMEQQEKILADDHWRNMLLSSQLEDAKKRAENAETALWEVMTKEEERLKLASDEDSVESCKQEEKGVLSLEEEEEMNARKRAQEVEREVREDMAIIEVRKGAIKELETAGIREWQASKYGQEMKKKQQRNDKRDNTETAKYEVSDEYKNNDIFLRIVIEEQEKMEREKALQSSAPPINITSKRSSVIPSNSSALKAPVAAADRKSKQKGKVRFADTVTGVLPPRSPCDEVAEARKVRFADTITEIIPSPRPPCDEVVEAQKLNERLEKCIAISAQQDAEALERLAADRRHTEERHLYWGELSSSPPSSSTPLSSSSPSSSPCPSPLSSSSPSSSSSPLPRFPSPLSLSSYSPLPEWCSIRPNLPVTLV